MRIHKRNQMTKAHENTFTEGVRVVRTGDNWGVGVVKEYVHDKSIFVKFPNQDLTYDFDADELKLSFTFRKKGNNIEAWSGNRKFGRMNVESGKFVGDTKSLLPLYEYVESIKK